MDTKFFSSKQSGGMFCVSDRQFFPGNIFWVGSTVTGATDGAGYGQNPGAPFATIDYAVGKCTENVGDTILVLPGHAETVSAAAGLALDVAGITITGLGNGTLRPTITLDTADTADVDVDAANITIENLIFSANFADIAVCLDVNADDFTCRNCRFQATAADMNFLVCIQDAAGTASDRITVEDCYHLDRDASNTHFINFAGTGDGHIIRRNVLLGDYGTICIGGAGIVTNVVITDNTISNAATTADSGVNVADTSTGIVARNHIAIALAGDATTGVDAIACGAIENYVVDTGDRQAVLDPAAT